MEMGTYIRQITEDCPLTERGADLRAAAELCRPYMEQICTDPPGDWMEFAFTWLRSVFFPENFTVPAGETQKEAVRFYLDVLNGVFAREAHELPFDPCRDFALMRPEEEAFCSIPEEYRRFREVFRERYVYAFMRLSRECTPFDTLGHVAGVHHVAMYMARQLLKTPVKVDPGLISGAAVTHDMGKYGCRPAESRRVPYLHYYYTYQFCRDSGLPLIGSIASNHSVWDLELENLSVESLLLIYADFRVKSVYDENHKEHIRFWSLKESYDVILGKLDNVDDAKRRRYRKVYGKLRDFEDFMVRLGCRTDLSGEPWVEQDGRMFREDEQETPCAGLMSDEQVVCRIKDLAISANLSVMQDTWHADRFITLLERIRSERDWRHVRAYLTAIGAYCMYFPQEQKRRMLAFLYEMMCHRDGDIRRQAAAIAGQMIADFELRFTKEIPEGYQVPRLGESLEDIWEEFLQRVIRPEHTMQERQIRWSGYALKYALQALLQGVRPEKRGAVLNVYARGCADYERPDLIHFILIDCASVIPFEACTKEQAGLLGSYAVRLSKEKDGEIQVAALWFLLQWMRQGFRSPEDLSGLVRGRCREVDHQPYCIRYLEARIREYYGIASEKGVQVYDLTNLYLENQRSEVPWIYKYLNLEILRKRLVKETDTHRLYQYASHLLNLLQFGDRIVNRLQAGENLRGILPLLETAQQYEIILELVRALEIGEYAVSKYIPQFLGPMMRILPVSEQHAFLMRLRALVTGNNQMAAIAALETAACLLQSLFGDRDGGEDRGGDQRPADQTEGILCLGLAHFDRDIAQETVYLIGQKLFFGDAPGPAGKGRLFSDFAGKLLDLADWRRQGLYVYFGSAALGHIYRFLSDYEMAAGSFPVIGSPAKAAFFPGTFDPFSLGHKAIVERLLELGLRVFLSADEFSWSKKTQPSRIRRKIIAMSVADMKEVYLLPENLPVNIANPEDMKKLRGCLPCEELYVVAGSDVIRNASAYRAPVSEGSVRTFPHIVIVRSDETYDEAEIREKVPAGALCLRLDKEMESVSSTRIRDNITVSKDIGDLVEDMVQNYLYRYGLYAMEPIYKRMVSSLPIDTKDEEIGDGRRVLTLTDQSAGGAVCGRVVYRETDQMGLFDVTGSAETADRIRRRISGRAALIESVEGTVGELDDKRLTALNEALEVFQERSFSYALCLKKPGNPEIFALHGFVPLEEGSDILILDLRSPLVVFYDTPSAIKEPFRADPEVRRAIRRGHLDLLAALTRLHPGELVLCFESGVLNHRLMKLITHANHVALTPDPERRLGEKMCVPFGKILKGVRIPNTVTKGLDTEKLYEPDLSHFSIVEFPGYAPLQMQIRAISSFRRKIILTDDLYHSGYRLREIEACLEREGIHDAELIVGVLSGRGADLARSKGKTVQAAYSVPNMRAWLIESELHPLLGGDGVRTGERGMAPPLSLPSVNTILPYEIPPFLADAPAEALQRVSEVCLANTLRIFRALERCYSRLQHRRLTMERISEVAAEPRHPDGMRFDEEMLQESPSAVIEGELLKLHRLCGAIKK